MSTLLVLMNLGAWLTGCSSQAQNVFLIPWIQNLAKQITDWLQQHTAWIGIQHSTSGKGYKMLDYACGGGMVSKVGASLPKYSDLAS